MHLLKRVLTLSIVWMGFLSQAQAGELQTVPSVDLSRYVGHWYEIARYPNRFERNCYRATAHYTANPDGTIQVLNTCYDTHKGEEQVIEGLAVVSDSSTYSKLRVSFLPSWLRWTGIGQGNYWVIQLGENYEYAVVSEPKRKYLWILSRTPKIDQQTYQQILNRLIEQGFDLSKIELSYE